MASIAAADDAKGRSTRIEELFNRILPRLGSLLFRSRWRFKTGHDWDDAYLADSSFIFRGSTDFEVHPVCRAILSRSGTDLVITCVGTPKGFSLRRKFVDRGLVLVAHDGKKHTLTIAKGGCREPPAATHGGSQASLTCQNQTSHGLDKLSALECDVFAPRFNPMVKEIDGASAKARLCQGISNWDISILDRLLTDPARELLPAPPSASNYSYPESAPAGRPEDALLAAVYKAWHAVKEHKNDVYSHGIGLVSLDVYNECCQVARDFAGACEAALPSDFADAAAEMDTDIEDLKKLVVHDVDKLRHSVNQLVMEAVDKAVDNKQAEELFALLMKDGYVATVHDDDNVVASRHTAIESNIKGACKAAVARWGQLGPSVPYDEFWANVDFDQQSSALWNLLLTATSGDESFVYRLDFARICCWSWVNSGINLGVTAFHTPPILSTLRDAGVLRHQKFRGLISAEQAEKLLGPGEVILRCSTAWFAASHVVLSGMLSGGDVWHRVLRVPAVYPESEDDYAGLSQLLGDAAFDLGRAGEKLEDVPFAISIYSKPTTRINPKYSRVLPPRRLRGRTKYFRSFDDLLSAAQSS